MEELRPKRQAGTKSQTVWISEARVRHSDHTPSVLESHWRVFSGELYNLIYLFKKCLAQIAGGQIGIYDSRTNERWCGGSGVVRSSHISIFRLINYLENVRVRDESRTTPRASPSPGLV